MLRLIVLLEETAGTELVLPVTPPSYQWPHETAIEIMTVDQLGDLNFFSGKRMGSTILYDYLLSVQVHPFLSPGADTNPWLYLEQLRRWVDRGTVVRWLVSGTPVNVAALLERVTYREQDGTNDPYADVTLRQYTRPETSVLPAEPSTTGAGMAADRNSTTGTAMTKTYMVVSGNTLWGICRRYYGDGSLVWRLAAVNGITSANLIHPGQVLITPPLAQLPAAAARPPSAQIAVATRVREMKEEESGTACPMPWVPENTVESPADLELDRTASGGDLWQSTRW